MMDRRTILAIALSIVVVVGYSAVMKRFYPQTPVVEQGEEPTAPTGATAPGQGMEQPAAATPAPAPVSVPAAAPGGSATTVVAPSAEREAGIELANDWVTLTFGRRTGGLMSARLKRQVDEEGKPLELVAEVARFHSGQVVAGDGQVVKVVEAKVADHTLTLRLADQTTLHWTLPEHTYLARLAVEAPGPIRLVGPTGFSTKILATRYYGNRGFAYGGAEGDEKVPFKKLKGDRFVDGPIPWLLSEDKYFLQGWIPDAPLSRVAFLVRAGEEPDYTALLNLPAGKSSFRVYTGAKEMDALQAADPIFAKRIHFGWFRVVAEPMFYLLRFIHRILGSWGVSIILVTVLIKLAFFKLTHNQQVSMKRMQALQPQMQEIRTKYKKDPQRMQREIMALYKRNKVNPMMGCLPMVVQIPVFLALYNVLLNAIELRHAPFLYLHDLAAPDALFGHVAGFAVGPLPLIMGVTMWLQQQMTPTTMDATQARMMKFLPIVFTLMFFNFPSGLVLYWAINNLLTVGQQILANREVAATEAG